MNTLLKQQFKKRISDFERTFTQVSEKSDKKNIHALRVAIKRLHALLHFSEFIVPEIVSAKKAYRKLKKLFSEAGKLRTLQMYVALLSELKDNKADTSKERKELKKKIQKQRSILKEEMKQFNKKRLLKKTGNVFEQALSTIKSTELLKKILAFATEKVNHSINLAGKKDFHSSRKELKHAHYLLETIPHVMKASALLKKIDPIEKKTGRWQDLISASELLDNTNRKQKLRSIQSHFQEEMKWLESQLQRDFKQLKTFKQRK